MVQHYKCSLQGRMNTFLKPLGTNKTFQISQEYLLVPLCRHPLCPGMRLLWPALGKFNLPICVLCSEWLEVPFLVLSSSCLALCPFKNFQSSKCDDFQLKIRISMVWQTNLFCSFTSTEGNIKKGRQKHGLLGSHSSLEINSFRPQESCVLLKRMYLLACDFILPSCSLKNHQTYRAPPSTSRNK